MILGKATPRVFCILLHPKHVSASRTEIHEGKCSGAFLKNDLNSNYLYINEFYAVNVNEELV